MGKRVWAAAGQMLFKICIALGYYIPVTVTLDVALGQSRIVTRVRESLVYNPIWHLGYLCVGVKTGNRQPKVSLLGLAPGFYTFTCWSCFLFPRSRPPRTPASSHVYTYLLAVSEVAIEQTSPSCSDMDTGALEASTRGAIDFLFILFSN